MSDHLKNYISLFSFSWKQKEFINDFTSLHQKTLVLFPETHCISSLSKEENICNIAIDTSNSHHDDTSILSEYKEYIINFCKKYLDEKTLQEIINFSRLHDDTLNISSNIWEDFFEINICYTSKYLSASDTEKIMEHYNLVPQDTCEKNFICLHIDRDENTSIKHYTIWDMVDIPAGSIPKILELFQSCGDTYMHLHRYKQKNITEKYYINTYNSGLKNSENTQKVFQKVMIFPRTINSLERSENLIYSK